MKQAQPAIVTKDQLARLVNVFLPGEDLSTDTAAELAQTRDQINWKLYFRLVKFHPDNLALVRQFRSHEIDGAEYRRRKRFLFYKLMGDYNGALVILRRGQALDIKLFHSVFTSDTARMTFFTSFCSGGIQHDDFVSLDQARVAELTDIYVDRLAAMAASGDPIEDLSPKLI
ncbi:hypothetical protein C4566_00495 [Candidatus Parcubacteria bacterium]|nr:MAG: hypothetical protein C4566_00495 [Candidatus Parcubacteria bacterium]